MRGDERSECVQTRSSNCSLNELQRVAYVSLVLEVRETVTRHCSNE